MQTEPLKFMINGRLLTSAEIAALPKTEKKAKPKSEDEYHKGYRVEGHSQEAIADAKKQHEADTAYFDMHSGSGVLKGKRPNAWNEVEWRNSHKKKPVRAKPCEILEAAKVCKELAEKAGWVDVSIKEIKKEKSVL